MQAILALEDGRIFRGDGYGAQGECRGEVVFNTSLTGYQEIFTDPSYAGQIVVLTNPQIGNYGTNSADNEAAKPYIEGLVTREFSPISSNWRSQQVADEYLERFHVPVISEIDTRALVRHLRTHGVMRGVISTTENNPEVLVEKARSIRKMDGTDLASVVSTKDRYEWDHDGPDPLRPDEASASRAPTSTSSLTTTASRRTFCACSTPKVVASRSSPRRPPPKRCSRSSPTASSSPTAPAIPSPSPMLRTISASLAGRTPIFGICLGHQLIGLALGGKTYKLKFGHHGGNHPVKCNDTGKVEITCHNHNFAVDPDSLNPAEVDLTHIDLNDNTLEGLRHRTLPLFSVQYHPEASPGPHDSHYLFKDFRKMMEEWKG